MTNGSVSAVTATPGPTVSTNMTNGNVSASTAENGVKHLTLTYQGGQQTIVVPPTAPIVNLVPGTIYDLFNGAYVFVDAAQDGNHLPLGLVAAGVGVSRLLILETKQWRRMACVTRLSNAFSRGSADRLANHRAPDEQCYLLSNHSIAIAAVAAAGVSACAQQPTGKTATVVECTCSPQAGAFRTSRLGHRRQCRNPATFSDNCYHRSWRRSDDVGFRIFRHLDQFAGRRRRSALNRVRQEDARISARRTWNQAYANNTRRLFTYPRRSRWQRQYVYGRDSLHSAARVRRRFSRHRSRPKFVPFAHEQRAQIYGQFNGDDGLSVRLGDDIVDARAYADINRCLWATEDWRGSTVLRCRALQEISTIAACPLSITTRSRACNRSTNCRK